jgi:RND superfamily putative drug exporter
VAAGVGGDVVDRLDATQKSFEDPGSPSVRARTELTDATGRQERFGVIALVRLPVAVRSPAGRRATVAVAREIAREPDVAQVVSFHAAPGARAGAGVGSPTLLSRDGSATYVAGVFRKGADEEAAVDRLRDRLEGRPWVTLGGLDVQTEQFIDQAKDDLERAEAIAFPFLLLLGFAVFRSLVAALMPVVVGLVTVLGVFLMLAGVRELLTVSAFAASMVTALGLGLSIDYSLLLVSRYREELAREGPGVLALRRTLASAGRTVAFSSLIVAAALASLVVFPLPFVRSMGVAGLLTALLAGAVSLLFLPAALALLGERVNALAPRRWRRTVEEQARPDARGPWYRLAVAVMRRPAAVALAVGAALVLLAVPALRTDFVGIDSRVLASDASSRRVDDALRTEFPAGYTTPITVVARAPRSAGAQVLAYARRAGALPGASDVVGPTYVGRGTWRIDVVTPDSTISDRTERLLEEVRALPAPFPVDSTGPTAYFRDQQSALGRGLPAAVVLLVAVTLAMLWLMTGSVVLPLKTLVMNALSFGAALGAIVLVFQDGRLEGLLGYEGTGGIGPTMVVLILPVTFALSTDYGVFVLSRIKEARDAGMDDREAIALGLGRTGRTVTAAALLYCVATAAFISAESVLTKQYSVAVAFGVMLDATIVRAALVPALMIMLGRRNWWSPAPLRRAHARLGLEEG